MYEDAQTPLQRSLGELSTFLISDRSIADTLTRDARLGVESVPPGPAEPVSSGGLVHDDGVRERA